MSEETAKTGIVKNPWFFEKMLGGHAMCLVGLKKINNQDYFIVRNSWGVEEWGDKGYCYIPFKYILRKGSNFWTIRK